MLYSQFHEVAACLPGVLAEAKKGDVPFDSSAFEKAVERTYDKKLRPDVEKSIERAINSAIDSKGDRFKKEVGAIVKDALESYAKTMWIKRRFWLNQLDI